MAAREVCELLGGQGPRVVGARRNDRWGEGAELAQDSVDVLAAEHRHDGGADPRQVRGDVAHGLRSVRSVPDLAVAKLEAAGELDLGGTDLAAEERRGGGSAEGAVSARLDDYAGGAVRAREGF